MEQTSTQRVTLADELEHWLTGGGEKTLGSLVEAFGDLPDPMTEDYETFRERIAAQASVAWDEWFLAECDRIDLPVAGAELHRDRRRTGRHEQGADAANEGLLAIDQVELARRHRGRQVGAGEIAQPMRGVEGAQQRHRKSGPDDAVERERHGLDGAIDRRQHLDRPRCLRHTRLDPVEIASLDMGELIEHVIIEQEMIDRAARALVGEAEDIDASLAFAAWRLEVFSFSDALGCEPPLFRSPT